MEISSIFFIRIPLWTKFCKLIYFLSVFIEYSNGLWKFDYSGAQFWKFHLFLGYKKTTFTSHIFLEEDAKIFFGKGTMFLKGNKLVKKRCRYSSKRFSDKRINHSTKSEILCDSAIICWITAWLKDIENSSC